MGLKSFLRRLGGRERRSKEDYYKSPREYWRRRHVRFGASLRGVGHQGLSDEDNAVEYDCRRRVLTDALAKFGDATERSLLDANCGISVFSRFFREMGFEVTGVDFAREAIEVARQNGGNEIRFAVSPLDSFDEKRSYDVVACIDVLFHVVDDEQWRRTVLNLARLAAPEGWLMINEHLVPEREVLSSQPVETSHVRWRSLDRYRQALGEDWTLQSHESYTLPRQNESKDLLVFSRVGGA